MIRGSVTICQLQYCRSLTFYLHIQIPVVADLPVGQGLQVSDQLFSWDLWIQWFSYWWFLVSPDAINPLRTQHTWIRVKPHIRLLAEMDAFPTMHACTLSNGSEGLWEGIATKKSACVHLKMLQNPRSKLAAWSKMHKDVLAASHFEDDFGQHFISFPDFLWQNILFYWNTFPKMCRLSYKLWTTKKLWQKPHERQICMETGVSVKG